MKFYIASRLENAEVVTRVASVLKAAGHNHTYDWTVHGSVQGEGEERIRQVAQCEFDGVCRADMVIVLLPGGRGTHAELGIALGRGCKDIFICAYEGDYFMQDERTCAFYWNPHIKRIVGNEGEWYAQILARGASIDNSRRREATPITNAKDYYTPTQAASTDEIIGLRGEAANNEAKKMSFDELVSLGRTHPLYFTGAALQARVSVLNQGYTIAQYLDRHGLEENRGSEF